MRVASRAGQWSARRLLGPLLVLWLAPMLGTARAVEETPDVAVLGFRVHSAKPVDYLGESVANLLRTRLEASGKVRVLDAARSATAPGAAIGDEALRELATGLDADYVVTGSLTELAGRFSLDVRVTPAAPGLRSRTAVS